MRSRKQIGNDSESSVAGILFTHHFWVLNITQNKYGQAADLIAVKHGKAYLIDVKHCEDNYFVLDRIEPNQQMSMTMWEEFSDNGVGWFALDFENGDVIMLSHKTMKYLLKIGQSRINKNYADHHGVNIERWVKMVENLNK